MHSPTTCPSRTARERGATMIMASVVVVFVSGVLAGGLARMRALDRAASVTFSAEAGARSMAEAGLVDAFAWFRRQTTQPVSTFAPVRDMLAATPLNETDDPSVGLVRDLELSPGVWGRYTVRPGLLAEGFEDANANGTWDIGEPFLDEDGDGRWTSGKHTRDVTVERGLTGHGAVWQLVALGEVFRRVDPLTPLGEGENHRLGSARLATEIRRLTIVPPAEAPICGREGERVAIRDGGRVRAVSSSGSVGVATGLGKARDKGGEIVASILSTVVPSYSDSVHDVFGVSWDELKGMADISTSYGEELPDPLPLYGIVAVEGDLVFKAKRRLRGTAVLAVKGDVTLRAGSNSFFDGVLYVDGDVVLNAPCYIRGTIIATGKVTVKGDGDYAEVEHDPGVVSRLLQKAGQYRFSKTLYTPGRILADGRPSSAVAPTSVTDE